MKRKRKWVLTARCRGVPTPAARQVQSVAVFMPGSAGEVNCICLWWWRWDFLVERWFWGPGTFSHGLRSKERQNLWRWARLTYDVKSTRRVQQFPLKPYWTAQKRDEKGIGSIGATIKGGQFPLGHLPRRTCEGATEWGPHIASDSPCIRRGRRVAGDGLGAGDLPMTQNKAEKRKKKADAVKISWKKGGLD